MIVLTLLLQPWSEGYIAILLPFLKDYEKYKSKLLSFEQFNQQIPASEIQTETTIESNDS
jgi:hypothetical protein